MADDFRHAIGDGLLNVTTNSNRLNGWKEISGYLGKSVRTAHRWEAELGLPIHRIPTPGGEIVYAFKHEIDDWHAKAEAPISESAEQDDRPPSPLAGPVPPDDATPADGEATSRPGGWGDFLRRRRAVVVGVFLGFGAVVALGAFRLLAMPWVGSAPASRARRQPASWRIEDDALVVLDAEGGRLWARKAPYPLSAARYQAESAAGRRPVAITDLDGDGRAEVVFRVSSREGASAAAALSCFEHDGTLRFEFRAERSVRYGDQTFHAPFSIGDFLVATEPSGARTIWVRSNHVPWFPSVVHKLSARGGVLGEYWAQGHVSVIKDATLGGRRVFLVGAYHNDKERAALAVLDPERPSGSAPSESDSYRCVDCPVGAPLAYFVFPKTELTIRPGLRPALGEILLQGDRVLVSVQHAQPSGLSDPQSFIGDALYTFDSRLELVGAELGDDYAKSHVALERRGVLDHTFGPRDNAQLFPVLAWIGGRFMALTATSATGATEARPLPAPTNRTN